MKTNYKQSQAAPHAKPIFTVSRNDSTLYVLPAYLAGAVMIRLQHIADGDKVKKLCCKVKNDRLMAMEQDVPQGNVTLTEVDKLTERNGLPHVTVHSLRHLCATLLIRTHADPKTVQTILRHANVSTTLNIYAKVFDSTQMEAIGRVQASLENMLKESCSSSAQV